MPPLPDRDGFGAGKFTVGAQWRIPDLQFIKLGMIVALQESFIRGLVRFRPEDDLGMALAVADTGTPYQIANPTAEREVTLELTYRAPLYDNLTIQPDIQYVFNPGAHPTISNALVLGLRFELTWGRRRLKSSAQER